MVCVELDAFSGRPNPRWDLDETATQELQRLVEGLPTAVGGPSEPPGLGYRGFLFRLGTHGPWRAYGGFVTSSDAMLADPSSSVERFLISQLPAECEDLRRRFRLD